MIRTIATPFDALSNALDQVPGSAFDDDGSLLGALLDDYILRSLLEDGFKFQAQGAQRDRLRDALYAEIGRRLADAEVQKQMGYAGVPLHGRTISLDLQAREVGARMRRAAMEAVDAAFGAALTDPGDRYPETPAGMEEDI